MSDELTPEREEYLIEQAAQYVVKHDLEDFALIALEGTSPFGDVVGEMGVMMSYPLAVTFFDRFGADFVKMFGFNYQLNAKLLMKKIQELSEEKHIQEQKRKELQKQQGPKEGWLSRISSSIRSLFKRKDSNAT
jgi:hypothetical protein